LSDYKILKYLDQLKYVKLFSQKIKKENKIRKKEFNLIKHDLSKHLENQILSR
jgi:putative heme degradation protein